MQSNEWLGWHFCDESKQLRYGDGRKIEIGTTHKVECEPVLCESGLHASPTVLDALNYAPGAILHRVALSGKIIHDEDKSVATERRYIARIDATEILREFARKCALQVIHLWDCPRIVQEYLETGDESKRAAARDAAWAAAWAAERDAARDAAWAAAWAAARDAAWAAAWAAERDAAAWAAAMDAAWAAERAAAAWAAAVDAAGDAAWNAAGDAAWNAAVDAARDAQKKLLDEMVIEALKKQGNWVE